jgi:hypothetical protein
VEDFIIRVRNGRSLTREDRIRPNHRR